MDLLKEVFQSIRLEGSLFFNSTHEASWQLNLEPSDQPRFHLVVNGSTWIQSPALSRPRRLSRGSAILLNDAAPHQLASMLPTVGVSGGIKVEFCQLICGKFGFDVNARHPLIDMLPQCVQVSIDVNNRAVWSLADVLTQELADQRPGYDGAVDRICELMLLNLLRAYAAAHPHSPGFVAAIDDPYTSRALCLIHNEPGRDWTLDLLSRCVGLSRSTFAARFQQLVGQPPKTYLTHWRMHTAQRLLRNPYARIGSVAGQVGYASDTAFIRAFKSHFGCSPRAFRAGFTKAKNSGLP